jgi:signal transduction histidine kinase
MRPKEEVKSAQAIAGLGAATPAPGLDHSVERLNRLATLGILSAGAAHEIKNALVPVKTFIDLLVEEKPDSELAVIVRREISRINQLVAQMSRLSGPGKPLLVRVSLHDLIQDALRLVSYQARARRITIGTELNAVSHHVMGDANQLEQVFLNLLLNALEALCEGGKVCVATRAAQDGKGVEMLISDNGQGIAACDMPRLFEAFFTTKQGGTGLGLTIVRDIIAAHGGAIQAESEVGRGTVFRVTLPNSAPGNSLRL